MWRYVGVSIIIGLAVSTGIFFLYEVGVFMGPGRALWGFYKESGLMPEGRGLIDLLQFGVFTALAMGIAWCIIDIPRKHLNAIVAVSAIFLVMGLSFTLALYGIYFEPFSGCLAIMLSSVLGAIYSRTRQGQRKRLLMAILGHRVSPDLLFKMLGSNGDLPEPKSRAVTVLTCRVFNHSHLMRELEPEEVLEVTNLFLKNAVERLLAKGAYVDEARPDCIRAFFGVHPSDDHALVACRAALELQKRIDNLNADCERRWFQSLKYGIGVSSGPITTGIFGSRREAFFSGVGSEIGFSRRLCALNLAFGSRVLIGARCFFEAKDDLELRPIDMVFMEEEDVLTEVYELLEEKGNLNDEHRKSRDAFWQGMIFFREGRHDAALESFTEAQVDGVDDAPLEHYIARVQDELVRSGEKPGGEGRSRSGGMIRL